MTITDIVYASRIDRAHVAPPFINADGWRASVERDEREQDRRYAESMRRAIARERESAPSLLVR